MTDTKGWRRFLFGVLLMLVGFSVDIYKGCVLQNYWTTTRWDSLTGYPLLTVTSILCIFIGYALMFKRR